MLKLTLDQRLVSVIFCICIIIYKLLSVIYYAIELNIFIGSILTIDDLSSVYEKLMKAAGKWFNLGLALKVSYDTLDNIRDKHRDNQNCLREMLAARLKIASVTYSELCQSLRSPTVGQDFLAEAIEKECTGMNSDEPRPHYYKHFYG